MTLTNHTERILLKEIASGKYRDCYLVYNRKSTDEPDNQKNSIDYQKKENGRFAVRDHLTVAPVTLKGLCVDGVISERHSGFKETNELTITNDGLVQYRIDRPKFQRLIQFLSRGAFKGVICLCWDRMSRNKADDTLVRKLMRKGIDVRFALAKYEKSSSGYLHMDIDGMFAEHHSRVTSEKVTTTTRHLRERGICTYRAPIGYLNLGSMHLKPLDEARAPIIKKVFELYATGEWSIADVTALANREGLTTMPMRRRRSEEEMLAEEEDDTVIEKVSRPVTLVHMHKILTNPFYTGKIIGTDGGYVESKSHRPLVSDELFYQVHKELCRRKVSVRYADKMPLLHRAFVRCQHCNRVYTPYMQKGIQYFGARCLKGCINPKRSFNLSFLERKIGDVIATLYFTDDELVELNARISTDIFVLEERRNTKREKDDRMKRKIREDQSYLRFNKLNLLKVGVYTPETLLAEENRLSADLTSLQLAEQTSDEAMHKIIKDLIKLSELLKNGSTYYSFQNSDEKSQLIHVLFSELSLSGDTLQYKVTKGFTPLKSRLANLGDPTTWLSEAIQSTNFVKEALEELDALVTSDPP
jgi:site-specific DNA recombinase